MPRLVATWALGIPLGILIRAAALDRSLGEEQRLGALDELRV